MAEQSRASATFVLATLAVASLLLIWNGISRYQDYLQHQTQLARRVTGGVANEIGLQVREFRRRVEMFAEEKGDMLSYVATHPDDEAEQERLAHSVDGYFADNLAFTVTDATGTALIADFDGLIGDECREDIRDFAASPHPYEIFVHPRPGAYHFDIMSEWRSAETAQGVFFVSFKPTPIARVLDNSTPIDHRLLLLKRDDPGLIEIAAEGARDRLSGDLRLTEAEISRLAHRQPIAGTRWEVALLPDEGLYASVRGAIARETGLFIVTLTVLSMFMIRFMKRAEVRRFAAEAGLRRAHHELELRVKDRTRKLTDANNELRTLFEQHRASERALKESEAMLRSVLETTVDGIVVIDELGTIQSFNAAAERIFGYEAEEVIGHNVNLLMPPPYHAEHDDYLAQYLRTGEKKIIGIGRRVEGKHKDGSEFPLDLAVSEAIIGKRRLFTGIVRAVENGGTPTTPDRTLR